MRPPEVIDGRWRRKFAWYPVPGTEYSIYKFFLGRFYYERWMFWTPTEVVLHRWAEKRPMLAEIAYVLTGCALFVGLGTWGIVSAISHWTK